eukprot:COSAG02_NODE_181_length_30783_cov_53.060520_14_plen_167_part_00
MLSVDFPIQHSDSESDDDDEYTDPEYYALIKAQFIENGHDCVATKMNDVFADVCNAAGIDKTKRRGYYGWMVVGAIQLRWVGDSEVCSSGGSEGVGLNDLRSPPTLSDYSHDLFHPVVGHLYKFGHFQIAHKIWGRLNVWNGRYVDLAGKRGLFALLDRSRYGSAL